MRKEKRQKRAAYEKGCNCPGLVEAGAGCLGSGPFFAEEMAVQHVFGLI